MFFFNSAGDGQEAEMKRGVKEIFRKNEIFGKN